MFKVARASPIHKSGSDFNFEITDHYQLYLFLKVFYNKYEVIYEDQYGFLENNSTTDAILKITREHYLAFNSEKKILLSVIHEFSEAFKTISHDI